VGSCGAKHSDAAENSHSGLPEDPYPYTGPQLEYRLLLVTSNLKASLGGSCSSDVNEYMDTLAQQYSEYCKLDTFFRVPYSQSMGGLMSVKLNYQAVFSRPTLYVPSPEIWQLQVHQSHLSLSDLIFDTVFGSNMTSPANGMSGIFNIVNQQASLGGRLICLECNGQRDRTGFISVNFGVNLFFNIPRHPNPTLYSHIAFCSPMQVIRNYGGNVDYNFDVNGPLTAYMNQGWRLIDIIIPQHESGVSQELQGRRKERHTFLLPSQLNVIWFFEKEQHRIAANDMTPIYQITVVTVNVQVSVGIGSASSDLNLNPILTEMGQRGWSVVCVLDVPKLQRVGMMSLTANVLVFFQRPLITAPYFPPPAEQAIPPYSADKPVN